MQLKKTSENLQEIELNPSSDTFDCQVRPRHKSGKQQEKVAWPTPPLSCVSGSLPVWSWPTSFADLAQTPPNTSWHINTASPFLSRDFHFFLQMLGWSCDRPPPIKAQEEASPLILWRSASGLRDEPLSGGERSPPHPLPLSLALST